MIEISKIEAFNFNGAIRGMRNPMNSWDNIDSGYKKIPVEYNNGHAEDEIKFIVGPNDIDLMRKLYKAGPPHRKYLRQIFVCMDINAPLYWWKEFDTYKVGTTSDSCSTMHKIHSKEFTMDDISTDNLLPSSKRDMQHLIDRLNFWRMIYLNGEDIIENGEKRLLFEPKDKLIWWQLIQLLPSSYNQKRTITCSYENIVNMLDQRQGHKLDEWNKFCHIMIDELPYLKDIIE